MKTKIKTFLILLLYFGVIYFVANFSIALFYDEANEKWKLITISLITAFLLSYKIFNIKNHKSFKSILNYQTKTIRTSRMITDESIERIKTGLTKNDFKKLQVDENEMKFRTKISFFKIRVKFKMTYSENLFVIKSKPVFFTHIFDENFQANKCMIKIETIINNSINENDKNSSNNSSDINNMQSNN